MTSLAEAKDIIKATPISTVVSFYHPISKRGANFEGICPFHGDSHPSLKINDSKGIYKCFACGAAGDSIKFVQDKLNVEFLDAVKDISEHLGIQIEEQKTVKNPKYEMALRVLQASNKLYRKVASENHPQPFIEFLKNRNLNEESVLNFQLGYAPTGNGLVNYLNSIPESEREMAISVAKEIGIIKDNKRGQGQYDFYRNRVMFPVWDHSGKVRGFSSRAVLPDQVPKYLNSGESFVFDKGNILYGFNLAKSHIREQDNVIIVEGNMDVISLHQFGFKNSVATMGVALSQSSIKLLTNMTRTIYLAMDSDTAGIKAMTRINADLLAEEVIPMFIDFTPAKDPDEFLNQFGRLELQKRIDESQSFIDYLINKSIPNPIPESTDKKLKVLKEIFKHLSPIKSTLLANEKAINAAKRLGLKSSNDDIINEFRDFKKPQNYPPATQTTTHSTLKNQDSSSDIPQIEVISTINSPQNISKTEKLLLETLLIHPECILGQQIPEILDKIQHFEVKRIVQWLKKIYLEIDDAEFNLFVQEKMKENLPGEIRSLLASSLFQSQSRSNLDEKVINKMLSDLLKKLDESLLKEKRDALRLKQLNANTDEEGLLIMNEIQQIEHELLALRNK